MKVLHVLPWVPPTRGGPSRAIVDIEKALAVRGLEVTTVTTNDSDAEFPVPCHSPIKTEFATRWYFPKSTDFYATSIGLANWLRKNIANFDIVHAHSLFSFAPTVAYHLAQKRRVAYVVRPFGVLNPYGMTQRRPWLKRLSLALVEQRLLQNADAVHFTSMAEKQGAELLGLHMNAAVIPLGIDTELSTQQIAGRSNAAERFDMLCIARISPVKNLESLLKAMALLAGRYPQLYLQIAGSGDGGYVAKLRQLTTVLGLDERVQWLGFLDVNQKQKAYYKASAFVLPSFSESFGIAVVEAMAAGLPCLVSSGVAIAPKIAAVEAGIVVEPTPENIARGIEQIMADGARLTSMSVAAQKLAREEFSVAVMGDRLETLYTQILSRRRPLKSEIRDAV